MSHESMNKGEDLMCMSTVVWGIGIIYKPRVGDGYRAGLKGRVCFHMM